MVFKMKLWNFDFWKFWKINFEDGVFKKLDLEILEMET